ncbi:DedA family protein [Permianibacter sp. IMCC34836]|uniref:DedA family protein n=1 Tax=Permianibacter fluminis TaxID=2738515 RepID=UPI001556E208|nr:DedA family protein [Permianibacter fluminis]NQD36588.1 DedA family protein [Permianibacter fluminis]
MVDSLLGWTSTHPAWAVLVVALVAFLESLVIVGFFVPGWLLLLGLGTLVGAGHLPFWPIVWAAYVGAVLGEAVGFWLGHHHSQRIQNSRFFAGHQPLLKQAEALFIRYGVLSLLVGRFVGPIRAVLPFVAGLLQFPWRFYWPTNLLGGLLWAPAYLLPGIAVGASLNLPLASLWPLAFHLALVAALLWAARQLWSLRRAAAAAVIALATGLLLLLPVLPWWQVLLDVLKAIGTVIGKG